MQDPKVTDISSAVRSSFNPEETILLPEGEYILRVDFNALAEIEEETGRNMMNPGAFQDLKATTVRKILWICIRQKHPQVKEGEIGRQINLGNLPDILKVLISAWTKSMPKKVATDGDKPPLQ